MYVRLEAALHAYYNFILVSPPFVSFPTNNQKKKKKKKTITHTHTTRERKTKARQRSDTDGDEYKMTRSQGFI